MTPRCYQRRCNPARRENKKPVIHWCSRIQHVKNIVRLFVYLDVAGVRHLGYRRCQGPSRSSRSIESRLEQHRAGWTLLQEDTVSEKREKTFDNENEQRRDDGHILAVESQICERTATFQRRFIVDTLTKFVVFLSFFSVTRMRCS